MKNGATWFDVGSSPPERGALLTRAARVAPSRIIPA